MKNSKKYQILYVSKQRKVCASVIKNSYMEVVSFAFEFSWGVNLVSHNSRDGFFYIFHPLDHFGLAHKVDIFDERVIFLPERHIDWFFKVSWKLFEVRIPDISSGPGQDITVRPKGSNLSEFGRGVELPNKFKELSEMKPRQKKAYSVSDR